MKTNFLQLIHETAAEKRRQQEVRHSVGSPMFSDSQASNTIPLKLIPQVNQLTIPEPTINQVTNQDLTDKSRMNSQSECGEEQGQVKEVFKFDPVIPSLSENRQYTRTDHNNSKSDTLYLAPSPNAPQNSIDPSKKYLNDIDRKLAMFYHPLFLEITDAWIKVFLGSLAQGKDTKISFIAFVEMNLRLQRSLLAKFDLSSAFVSALKDWVKEIGDCLQMKSLYFDDEKDAIAKTQMKDLPFTTALSEEDYQKFFDSQKTLEIYKFLCIRVSREVVGKFLFDLCVSWCQHLDIELFAYFSLALLLQISEGKNIKEASLIPLCDATLLPVTFLQDFEQQVQLYSRYKRKNLSYYRAWCEWNYLRMEEIGEIILQKLLDTFSEDDRAESIVSIFSKAIDIINQEITQQVDQVPLKVKKQFENIDASLQRTNSISYSLNQNDSLIQEQYLTQDYRLEKLPAIAPDQFIITYNEQERAFILERKVKMPVLGKKLNISQISGHQRINLEQKHIADHKDAYVYYISDELTQENQQDVIKNLQKPRKLPVMNRNKPAEMIKMPDIKSQIRKYSRPKNLNNSFSHPMNDTQDHNSLQPMFVSENENFQLFEKPRFPLNVSTDQGYYPVYKTSKKISDDYSHNITNQRRDIKGDIPKSVIQRQFIGREFNKMIARADISIHLGKINTPTLQIPVKAKVLQIQKPQVQIVVSPLENDRITEIIRIKNEQDSIETQPKAVSEIISSRPLLDETQDIQSNIAPKQIQGYSLHNVKLTFDQCESLEQNRHLWEPVLSWEEVKLLRQDDNKFYHILQLLKLKFNQEHKSDYLKQLRLEFNYASRRDEMGGVITVDDKDRFIERVEKLIIRDRMRKERRKRRRKAKLQQPAKIGQIFLAKSKQWDVLKTNFKNAKSRCNYREVLVNPIKR